MIVSSTTKKTKFKKDERFPQEDYDHIFLNQSIAILACDHCAKDGKRRPFYAHYPFILNHISVEHSEKAHFFSTFKSQKLLGYSTSRKQVRALEHLFEVAELDSESNTLADLDSLGRRFRFTSSLDPSDASYASIMVCSSFYRYSTLTDLFALS